MRNLTIACFTNTFVPSRNGVALSLELLRQGLDQLGHRMLVFTPDYPGAEYKDFNGVFRFPALHYGDYPLALPMGLAKAKQILIGEKVDLVHLPHPWLVSRWGLDLAKKLGLPTVATIHTQYDKLVWKGLRPLIGPILWHKVAYFCNAVELVTTPGSGMQKQLQTLGIKTPIVVVPNPTNLENFGTESGEGVRTKFKIPATTPTVGYVGRLSREKSLDQLLVAFAALRKKLPSVHLLLVGDGKMRARLERQAVNIGNVHFAGSIDHAKVPNYLAACDLFMTASTFEVQPLTYIEALTSMPIVAFNAAGNEVVVDGINGRLVPLEEGPKGLADASYALLSNQQQLEVMSRQAKESTDRFDREVATKEMVMAFENAIGRHNSSPRA